MPSKIFIAPSILSADFANLERDIKAIEKAGADWVHIDVMDGHFVPNITIGAPVVKDIRKITQLTLDVHLMIENPENYIENFAESGADIVTIHYETCKDIKKIIKTIKSFGLKAGVSIKPNTDVMVVNEFIHDADLILVMTVEPGFGGQKFIETCANKIKYINDQKTKNSLNDLIIEVDGGINDKTSKIAIKNGANAIVAGSYIYSSDNIKQRIKSLIK